MFDRHGETSDLPWLRASRGSRFQTIIDCCGQSASTVRRFSILAAVALALVSPPSAGAQERALEPDVRMHSAVPSKFLAKPRDVMVWLPPGYGTEREKRYPVLYLQDGANVYIEWRVDEIAKPLIASQQIEPLIIVLVPNGGGPEDRYDDYTPTRPANARAGGKAGAYGRFLVEELKPFIDREYRTLKDPASAGLGGASLGGLVSLYLGLDYPEVFGKLAVMSPSVWWDNKLILRKVNGLKTKPSSRIWLDVGALETQTVLRDVKELRDALRRKGWTPGTDLVHFEAPDGRHDDVSFGRRADMMLKFLFPGKARSNTGARRSNSVVLLPCPSASGDARCPDNKKRLPRCRRDVSATDTSGL